MVKTLFHSYGRGYTLAVCPSTKLPFYLLKKKEQKHKFVVFGNWSKKNIWAVYYIILARVLIVVKARAIS